MSNPMRWLFIAIAVSGTCDVRPHALHAQSAPRPPAGYSAATAYDAARDRLLAFGGVSRSGQNSGETWEWDGAAWSRASQTGPSPRNGAAMAYDEERQQVLLFGGGMTSTAPLADTWVYNGQSWRRLTSDGPSARTNAAMVYDARRRKIVLFGGMGQQALGDTWEYDGVRWRQLDVAGPAARDHVAMGYDGERRLIVLHGGADGLDQYDPAGETWTFDGQSWKQVNDAGPRRRYGRIAFNTRSKTLLLYGGFDREPSNELFEWDGAGWREPQR